MKFKRDSVVLHKATGNYYQILAGPAEHVRLEATNKPAYIYRTWMVPGATIWVRDAVDMEDGKFVASEPPNPA